MPEHWRSVSGKPAFRLLIWAIPVALVAAIGIIANRGHAWFASRPSAYAPPGIGPFGQPYFRDPNPPYDQSRLYAGPPPRLLNKRMFAGSGRPPDFPERPGFGIGRPGESGGMFGPLQPANDSPDLYTHVSALTGDSTALLQWTPVPGATNYVIYHILRGARYYLTTCGSDTLTYADTDLPNGKSVQYEVGVFLHNPPSAAKKNGVNRPSITATPTVQPGSWNITFRPSMRFATPAANSQTLKVNTVSMNGVVRAIVQATGPNDGQANNFTARAALGGEWRVTWIPDFGDDWPSMLVLHRVRSSNAMTAVLGSTGTMYTTSTDGILNTSAAFPGKVARRSSQISAPKWKIIEPGYVVLTVSGSSNDAGLIHRPERSDMRRAQMPPHGKISEISLPIGASATMSHQYQTVSYYSRNYLIKHFGSPEAIFFTFPIKPIDITVGGTLSNVPISGPAGARLGQGPAAIAAAESMDVISEK